MGAVRSAEEQKMDINTFGSDKANEVTDGAHSEGVSVRLSRSLVKK